jgi:hypothetical protein
VCQQCNSLRSTTYTTDDDPCETETCRVVVEEGHEIGVVKPGTAWKSALKTVFLYVRVYQVLLQLRVYSLTLECVTQPAA